MDMEIYDEVGFTRFEFMSVIYTDHPSITTLYSKSGLFTPFHRRTCLFLECGYVESYGENPFREHRNTRQAQGLTGSQSDNYCTVCVVIEFTLPG